MICVAGDAPARKRSHKVSEHRRHLLGVIRACVRWNEHPTKMVDKSCWSGRQESKRENFRTTISSKELMNTSEVEKFLTLTRMKTPHIDVPGTPSGQCSTWIPRFKGQEESISMKNGSCREVNLRRSILSHGYQGTA